MDSYRLPGVTISVEGPETPIQSIIAALFQLCPRQSGSGEIRLTSRLVNESRVAEVLPEWIARQIAAVQPILDPLLMTGPGGEPAAIARTGNSIGCAWLNEAGNEITFVASAADAPQPNRPPSHTDRPLVAKSTPYGAIVELSVQSVLIPLLREVLLRRDFILVHGAAALCPDGTGVLFVADSGGGKTTTVISVLRKGARLLGDDLVAIQADAARVRAFGIPEPMNLTENTIGFFDELRAAANSIPGRPDFHKKVVTPQQIYGPNCLAEQCDIHAVYFVHVAPEGPSVRLLAAGEALNRLFQAHRFAREQRIAERSFEQLSALVGRARCYELSTGPVPAALGVWLITNCAAHAGR